MHEDREPRVEHRVKFVAQVHECDDDPDLVGESITCESIDFSISGLRLRTDQALVPNTLLNITLSVGDAVPRYLLRGEIRWTEIIDNDCHMGVSFIEEKGTDLDSWVAYFDGNFEV